MIKPKKSIFVLIFLTLFSLPNHVFQDGEVEVDEFKKGVELSCKGKGYADFPSAFKYFIDAQFRTIDVDGENKLEQF